MNNAGDSRSRSGELGTALSCTDAAATGQGEPAVPETAPALAQTAAPSRPRKTPQEHILDCQGLVRSLAWKIHRKLPRSVDLDDLIAYGQVGLSQAARDFDAGHGTQFTTYAYYRIRGAIFDGMGQMSWFKPADYHRGAYERLGDDVLRLNAEQSASTGDTLSGEADWFSGLTSTLSMSYLTSECAAVEMPDGTAQPSDTASNNEMHARLHELIDALPDEARQLIRSAYFEGATLQEAGKRIGISKGWASRLHAKTLEKLGQALRRGK